MLPEARPEEEHGSLEQGEYTRQNVLHSISLGLAFGLIFVFSLFLVLLEERKGKERKGRKGISFKLEIYLRERVSSLRRDLSVRWDRIRCLISIATTESNTMTMARHTKASVSQGRTRVPVGTSPVHGSALVPPCKSKAKEVK